MMRSVYLLTLSLLFRTALAYEPDTPLEVITEATPFTVIRKDDNHGGEATILINRILDQAAIPYQISYIPWKRSYQYAQTKPNILIYPIARTAQRENEFIWVGRIIPINYHLFKLKHRDDISLNSLEDAMQYSIGVVNKHVHHEYLSSKGFTDLQAVNNSAQNLKKLLTGRIDLFPISSGGLEPLCLELKINCEAIVPAIALEKFSQGLYMAFSKNSNPALISSVRKSYLSYIATTDFQQLFKDRMFAAKRIDTLHKNDHPE